MDTLRSWSQMKTVVSLVAFVCGLMLILSTFV